MAFKDLIFPAEQKVWKSHRHHRAKENRRKRASIRQNKRSFKRNERQVKKYEKDVNAFYKKYGGEDFKQYNALSPKQQKLHDKLLSKAGKGLEKVGTKLPKEKKLPGMAKLKNIPELQKLKKDEGYTAGRDYLKDLLSENPAAYEKFAAPLRREFNSKISPGINRKYGEGGSGSASRGELFEAENDLAERLGRLRGELQLGAIDPTLRYAEANQSNQQQRIANRFGLNAQLSGENLEKYNRARQGNADLLNRNATQYGRAYNEANLGLGVNPYHSIYRSPTPPILPAEYAQGQTYQPQPSALQRGIQAFAPAAGAAFGGAGGAAIGEGIAGAAGNNPVQQASSSYGRTNPAPAPYQPRAQMFGNMNQLGGRQGTGSLV